MCLQVSKARGVIGNPACNTTVALAALAPPEAEAAAAAVPVAMPAEPAIAVLPVWVPVCEQRATLRALGWVAADECDWADKQWDQASCASRGWPWGGITNLNVARCLLAAVCQWGEARDELQESEEMIQATCIAIGNGKGASLAARAALIVTCSWCLAHARHLANSLPQLPLEGSLTRRPSPSDVAGVGPALGSRSSKSFFET